MFGLYGTKNPSFNISIDSKTLRKIKNAERKAKETEEKIKKQTEASKREKPPGARVPMGNIPNGMMNPPFNPMAPASSMMAPTMNLMGGIPMAHHPPNMGPSMGPPNMPPKGLSGPPGPGMMPPNQMSSKDKVANLIRDRDRLMNMPENSAKRIISEALKSMA